MQSFTIGNTSVLDLTSGIKHGTGSSRLGYMLNEICDSNDDYYSILGISLFCVLLLNLLVQVTYQKMSIVGYTSGTATTALS